MTTLITNTCTCISICRAAGLERDKASSLQLLLSEKEDVLSSLKEQYEQMVEAKVER